MAARLLELTNNMDVTDLLSTITNPTLVIHRQEDEVVPVQFGRQLAVSIPNARLVLLEGKDHIPWLGDFKEILRPVAEFLDGEDVASTEKSGGKSLKEEGFKRKLAAILSTDVQEYSRLMNDDEDETISTLSNYREAMTTLIQKHRGRVVDSTGDNLLAEFTSVRDAVQCAVVIQHELKAKNDKLSENRRMVFRIGINLGDVVENGDRIYGDGVNIAARIESLAEGGGICISGTVFDQIENKLSLGYEYWGEKKVKNIPKAVRVYQIKMDLEDGPSKVKGDNKVHRIY
jgi:class 3 adenylate cyclase